MRQCEERDLKLSEPQDRLRGAIDPRPLLGASRQDGEKPRRWNMTSTDGAGRPKVGLQSYRE